MVPIALTSLHLINAVTGKVDSDQKPFRYRDLRERRQSWRTGTWRQGAFNDLNLSATVSICSELNIASLLLEE
jgi:hypothetical protein